MARCSSVNVLGIQTYSTMVLYYSGVLGSQPFHNRKESNYKRLDRHQDGSGYITAAHMMLAKRGISKFKCAGKCSFLNFSGVKNMWWTYCLNI